MIHLTQKLPVIANLDPTMRTIRRYYDVSVGGLCILIVATNVKLKVIDLKMLIFKDIDLINTNPWH